MFAYNLHNAFRSYRRNPILSSLVVAAIAVGIGVSMTMLTIHHLMAGNPISHKNDQLYRVLLDSWDPLRPFDSNRPERAPHQMTYRDATNLLNAAAGTRQVAMFESSLIVQPGNEEMLPFEVGARVTHGDFFPMFEVPFQYGAGWDRIADSEGAQVVVLTQEINDRLFGGTDSTGKKILISERYFTVTGVMATWAPMPRFFDLVGGAFDTVNEIFIPYSLTPKMKLGSAGSDWGWKAENIQTFDDWLNSESSWIQYWTELKSPQDRETYTNHLDNYVGEQKKSGRFGRPLNNHIYNVREWLDYNNVVVDDVKVLVGLGFLFLIVCLLSSVALLLTKFMGKSAEVGLRRALGASRRGIMGQHLVEVGMIGVVGGGLGILLTKASLISIDASVTQAPAGMFELDWVMISTAIGVSVLTSLLAGIYPAWRSCLIEPALELKTQ